MTYSQIQSVKKLGFQVIETEREIFQITGIGVHFVVNAIQCHSGDIVRVKGINLNFYKSVDEFLFVAFGIPMPERDPQYFEVVEPNPSCLAYQQMTGTEPVVRDDY